MNHCTKGTYKGLLLHATTSTYHESRWTRDLLFNLVIVHVLNVVIIVVQHIETALTFSVKDAFRKHLAEAYRTRLVHWTSASMDSCYCTDFLPEKPQ